MVLYYFLPSAYTFHPFLDGSGFKGALSRNPTEGIAIQESDQQQKDNPNLQHGFRCPSAHGSSNGYKRYSKTKPSATCERHYQPSSLNSYLHPYPATSSKPNQSQHHESSKGISVRQKTMGSKLSGSLIHHHRNPADHGI